MYSASESKVDVCVIHWNRNSPESGLETGLQNYKYILVDFRSSFLEYLSRNAQ